MEGAEAVQVVTRTVEALNRRDAESLIDSCSADVELLPFSAKLGGTVYRGAEGVRQWLADETDEWSEWRIELDELRVDGDRVAVTGRIRARGRETGVELEAPAGFVSTVRDGHVTRMESFSEPSDALSALYP